MQRLLHKQKPTLAIEFHTEEGWSGRSELFKAGYRLETLSGEPINAAPSTRLSTSASWFLIEPADLLGSSDVPPDGAHVVMLAPLWGKNPEDQADPAVVASTAS